MSREQWQIEQGKRCGCKGHDEFCGCQNVRFDQQRADRERQAQDDWFLIEELRREASDPGDKPCPDLYQRAADALQRHMTT